MNRCLIILLTSAEGGFVVVSDDYVTTDGGTGLVHQAPAFGEDYGVLNENNIDALHAQSV